MSYTNTSAQLRTRLLLVKCYNNKRIAALLLDHPSFGWALRQITNKKIKRHNSLLFPIPWFLTGLQAALSVDQDFNFYTLFNVSVKITPHDTSLCCSSSCVFSQSLGYDMCPSFFQDGSINNT